VIWIFKKRSIMGMPMAKISGRRLLTGLGLLVVVLLAVAFVLGLLSLQRTREIVSEDFQQQQLLLAKTTARQLEDGLEFLRRELKMLNYSPAIQYLEEVAWANRMKVSFDGLAKLGVSEIVRIEFTGSEAGRTYALDAHGPHILENQGQDSPEVTWAKDPANRGRIYQGPVELQPRGDHRVPFFTMGMPVYEESVDESHPKATGKLVGVLGFKVDASQFTRHYCAAIRSGRTGYCWVLSHDGVFLYHPEQEFIGEDAFTARGRRNPLISFSAINEIQKSKMLAGEEGTSQYTSGWHRGVIGQMTKFVAYTHAKVTPDGSRIWPVAVVAPTAEVYGTIYSLYLRQFLIQGILIFALILAACAVIYYERRWSVELQREVDHATADLRRSREQYKSVVENARELIFLLDEKGIFISANTAAARVLGLPAAAMPGRSLGEFLAPEDATAMMTHVLEVVDSRKSLEVKSIAHIRDQVYWFSTHLVPIFGEDGQTVEWVLVMSRDITESQRLEEQLFQTEKLASLGTLSAGVAHEINNPLAVILGFTEILLDRLPQDSKEHEILKTIERQGLNCKRIVENLMGFARWRTDQEIFSDLNHNLETVLLLVQNTLLTKKIKLELNLASDLPEVKGSAGELQQVFLNLITNAVAAMPEGGKLTVTSRFNATEKMAEALVADTGTGIPKECVERIFDPFFTTKKVGEGTGLGLFVSYAIVEKFGGHIRFETKTAQEEPSASGTTFIVSLQPVSAPEGPGVPKSNAS
jgi:PAS domain S-box-containing protein